MKKVLVLMVAAATLLAFTSCNKEGVYNPKEKIVKIYKSSINSTTYSYGGQSLTESDTVPKYVSEEWTWSGKLLTSISFYSYNYQTKTSVFSNKIDLTYDGKQLTKVASSDDPTNEYATYTYDGNKISKIETYYRGKLQSTTDVTHDGKKVVKVVITMYDDDEGDITKFVMNSIMPTRKAAEMVLACRSAKAVTTETETIDFTYEGNNVSKMVVTYGEDKRTMDFTYDAMKNPFYGNYLYAASGDGSVMLSENNVLTEKSSWTGEEPRTQSYTYEYDGKYPVSCTTSETSNDGVYSYSSSNTIYYEYAE